MWGGAALNVQLGLPTDRVGPHDADGPVAVDQRVVWLVLVSATVVAAALRLPFLGHQSLWFDEIYTRRIVGEPSLLGVWNRVQATESTPPLYYVLAWLLGGRSAVSMRLIPTCALILAVPVSYLAFRRFVGEWAALATAAIVAVSPELVEYSMDARAYGLLVLTGLLSVWGFSCVLERNSRSRYLAWATAATACVWTHYFGFFLVAAEVSVLLTIRSAARRATAGWSVLIAACLAPLLPLVLRQNGDERAAFISGLPLMNRLTQTVREFAMGANVPRTWLEAAGLAVASVALASGVVLAARSESRSRTLLALAGLAFVVPLAVAALGIEDRFYARNLVFVVPLVAALAAPALLRLRGVPLALYLALAALTSLWLATNWRYEQTDWRGALARTRAIDPTAGTIAVTQFGEPVAQTYLGRAPTTTSVLARRAWVVIEPYRATHHRALGPAPVPTAISTGLPGFRPLEELIVHGFRLILIGTGRPLPIVPDKLPGTAVFAPPT